MATAVMNGRAKRLNENAVAWQRIESQVAEAFGDTPPAEVRDSLAAGKKAHKAAEDAYDANRGDNIDELIDVAVKARCDSSLLAKRCIAIQQAATAKTSGEEHAEEEASAEEETTDLADEILGRRKAHEEAVSEDDRKQIITVISAVILALAFAITIGVTAPKVIAVAFFAAATVSLAAILTLQAQLMRRK